MYYWIKTLICYKTAEIFVLLFAVGISMYMIGPMIGHIPLIVVPMGGLMLNRHAMSGVWWIFITGFLITCGIVALCTALYYAMLMTFILGTFTGVKGYSSIKKYLKGWL